MTFIDDKPQFYKVVLINKQTRHKVESTPTSYESAACLYDKQCQYFNSETFDVDLVEVK